MTRKNKTIIIIAAVIVVAVAVVAIIIIENRKFKKCSITNAAHDFLQIYRINSEQGIEPCHYVTGAAQVIVVPSQIKTLRGTIGGAKYDMDLIPIKKVLWENGEEEKFDPKSDYVDYDSIAWE